MNWEWGVSDALAAIAVVVSVFAYLGSRKQARRSADAAERAVALAEAEAARPDVSWSLDYNRGTQFVLTNTGRHPAYNVLIDLPGMVGRGEMQHDVVEPGSGVSFLATSSWNSASRVELSWSPSADDTGRRERRQIPLPPRS